MRRTNPGRPDNADDRARVDQKRQDCIIRRNRLSQAGICLVEAGIQTTPIGLAAHARAVSCRRAEWVLHVPRPNVVFRRAPK